MWVVENVSKALSKRFVDRLKKYDKDLFKHIFIIYLSK